MPAIADPELTPPSRHSESWPLLPPAVSVQVVLVARPESHSPSTRQMAPALLPRLPFRLALIAFSALSQAALGRPRLAQEALKAVAIESAVPATDVTLKVSKHLWHVSHLHAAIKRH